MIKVQCKKCDAQYRLEDIYAGKRMRCKKCQEVLTIPSPPAKPSANNNEMDLSTDFMKDNMDIFRALLKHEKEAPAIETNEKPS